MNIKTFTIISSSYLNDTLVIIMINDTLDHKEVVKFFSGEINLLGYTLGL